MELTLKPGPVPFGKLSGADDRAATGNGQSRRTIRSRPQNVPSCPGIMDKQQWNLPAVQQQDVGGIFSYWLKSEIKLHGLSKLIGIVFGKLFDIPAHCNLPEYFFVRFLNFFRQAGFLCEVGCG